MKKLVLTLTAITCSVMLFAQKTAADVAKFATETVDLGKVKQGVPAVATFVVTNIGTEPLIIEQANPTCGCTMGDYTKSPIAPGKTGTITATYNAAAANHFDKHLTVKFAGIDEMKSITLTGDVLAAEDYDKWVAENNDSKKKDAAAAATIATPASTKAKPAASSKAKNAKPSPANDIKN
ncbi:MAG: DUF1573 domain-containing protein [Ferruginibacter sp.]